MGLFSNKPTAPMNPNPELDQKCQAAVMDAARELVGTGVKVTEVHARARENAAAADVSCSITVPHVNQAVDQVRGTRGGR